MVGNLPSDINRGGECEIFFRFTCTGEEKKRALAANGEMCKEELLKRARDVIGFV